MLALWKSKEVITWVTDTTNYGNWHVIVEIYNDITFMVKLLVAEKVFEETLACDLGNNIKSTNTDLFQKGTTVLARSIFLQNYICRA